MLSKLVYKFSMENNPDLPERWSTPEDELQDALDEIARDNAMI